MKLAGMKMLTLPWLGLMTSKTPVSLTESHFTLTFTSNLSDKGFLSQMYRRSQDLQVL